MIKAHFNKRKFDYLSVAVILIAVTLLLSWIYKWNKIDMSAPLYYGGGDEMSSLVNAKIYETSSDNLQTDRLGAPYGAQYYDFPASLMHNFDLLTLKICVFLTGDAVLGNNINLYLMFYLLALISYAVMRELNVKRYISVLGSVAFAFSPFIQIRMAGHTQLAEAYFIPLSILMCVWFYMRDDIFCLNKQFFKNPRNYFMILFIVLIGNNGIAYYPFFTCYLLLVTAVAKWIKTHKFASALKCISAVIGIVLMIGINLMPYVIYTKQHGNLETIVRNGLLEAELYGMKIIQLFVPVNSSGSGFIKNIVTEYNNSAPLLNENFSSYIGLIGILGFVMLLLMLFYVGQKEEYKTLRFLAQLNLFMVFLAAGSGIGSMFAYFVSPLIRGYNRASIVIAYISILGLCIFLSSFKKRENKYSGAAVSVITALLLCFCIWEESMPYSGAIYNVNDYYSDRAFVEKIEENVESGSMIFTLPYHVYPEGGNDNDMPQDALFAGMIWSDTLKWSYGSPKGRDGDLYSQKIASLSCEDMVSQLTNDGFAGIYIDRRAYKEDALLQLEQELDVYCGTGKLVSDNGNLSFYKFNQQ